MSIRVPTGSGGGKGSRKDRGGSGGGAGGGRGKGGSRPRPTMKNGQPKLTKAERYMAQSVRQTITNAKIARMGREMRRTGKVKGRGTNF